MRNILIEFLKQVLTRGGCLIVNLGNKLMFFENYTYKSENEKILISDNENEFCIKGDVEIVSLKKNSLQFKCKSGLIEFVLM